MGVRLLTILALVVGSRALEFGSVDAVTGALHAFHSESFVSFISEHLRPIPLSLHAWAHKDSDTCDQCRENGAKYVIEHAAARMKEKCAAVSEQNCIATKICAWLGMHPEVALGIMIEKVRPMALSTAYCYGKGVCEKPDTSAMKEILTGHEAHAALLENFDKVDWIYALEKVHEVDQIEAENAPKDSRCPEERHMPKVCPMCMKMAMMRAMDHVTMQVKGMCEMTKCPVTQKLCPWMNEHREVTFGMLLAKVEPWKFAMGFCMHGMMERSTEGPRTDHGRIMDGSRMEYGRTTTDAPRADYGRTTNGPWTDHRRTTYGPRTDHGRTTMPYGHIMEAIHTDYERIMDGRWTTDGPRTHYRRTTDGPRTTTDGPWTDHRRTTDGPRWTTYGPRTDHGRTTDGLRTTYGRTTDGPRTTTDGPRMDHGRTQLSQMSDVPMPPPPFSQWEPQHQSQMSEVPIPPPTFAQWQQQSQMSEVPMLSPTAPRTMHVEFIAV